jgi:hypothetical protein
MNVFYEKLDIHIQNLNEKFCAKYLIRKETYEEIVLVLRDGWGDPQFRYWVQKHFVLVKIGDSFLATLSLSLSRPF